MATTARRQRGSAAQEALIARLLTERAVDYAQRDACPSARTLIDYLLSCPVVAERAKPLSEPQANMIRRVTQELGRDVAATLAAMTTAPDRRGAIDALLADARAARAEREAADRAMRSAAPELPINHGYVLADGRFARTYRGQDGGARVKVLTETDAWAYLPGGPKLIRGARPITLDEAKEIARRSETCGHCGRGIEAAESIERGIGPRCAAKF